MAGVNKVILVGNLGADPEARSLNNGGEVVNLRVATSENWKDKDGNRVRKCRATVPAGVRFSGGPEIIGNYRNLWDGFPGLVRRIDRWTFGDDACVIELTLSGKHEGQYRGIAPTGRDLALRIIAHFAFDAEGRITQETAYYDTATFQRQLGLGRAARA